MTIIGAGVATLAVIAMVIVAVVTVWRYSRQQPSMIQPTSVFTDESQEKSHYDKR